MTAPSPSSVKRRTDLRDRPHRRRFLAVKTDRFSRAGAVYFSPFLPHRRTTDGSDARQGYRYFFTRDLLVEARRFDPHCVSLAHANTSDSHILSHLHRPIGTLAGGLRAETPPDRTSSGYPWNGSPPARDDSDTGQAISLAPGTAIAALRHAPTGIIVSYAGAGESHSQNQNVPK
jgi:hypothetical protein